MNKIDNIELDNRELENTELIREINILKEKFKKIKSMEYVKSIRGGNGGIGITFEYLIGKEEDNESKPDFFGIEIKTKRSYSKSNIGLFNMNPKGATDNVSKYLRDLYGYRDVKDYKLKRLNAIVNAKSLEKVGTRYLFKLKVDRNKEKVYLCILDNYLNVLDKSVYWEFVDIKERLYKKLKVLSLIKAWPIRLNGFEYYKYYKMNIYMLKGFDEFIDLLESGKIKVLFKIGNNYTKEKYGEVDSHGIGFVIKEEDLKELYEFYE